MWTSFWGAGQCGVDKLRKFRAKGDNNGDACYKCGSPLNHPKRGRSYGIEFYEGGKIRREANKNWTKKEAEHRLREVMSAKAEGGYIPKRPDAKTTFRDLAEWYLELAKVKAKRSYDRDKRSVAKLIDFFGDYPLREITPALVEEYLYQRLAEPSYRGHTTRPATVVRELACMNHIFTNATRNGKAERNPVKGVTRPPENNERERVLNSKEYARILAECLPYLRYIVMTAYHTGMRRGEILNLVWDRVDLKEGFIRLRSEDTKTKEGRDIPLCPELLEMFKAMPRGLPGVKVFTREGKPIRDFRYAFEAACMRAGIKDFTFHDLRHTFVTNMRRAGVHDLVIMAITGHKTWVMFKRYNAVSEEDLRSAVKGPGSTNTHQNTHQTPFQAEGGKK